MLTHDQYTEQTQAEDRYTATLSAALSSGEASQLQAWVEAHSEVPFLAFDPEEHSGPILTHPREWTYALGQRSVAIAIRREDHPLIIGPAEVGQLALVKIIDRAPDRIDTVQW